MIDYLLDRIAEVDAVDAVHVVTNHKFADSFLRWAEAHERDLPIHVHDDETTSEDDRLGAVGDLELLIESERVEDDLIVAAGDSVFTERLDDFARFGRARDAAAIAVYDVGDLAAMQRLSSVGVDAESRVVTFEEKPEQPDSTLAGVALYFYPRAILPLVGRYLAEGNNPDQPGRLVAWLYRRTPVYAWRVPGRWFDIGTPETLAEAEELFASN
jgi:glucose-1-phosphate thymidylyltransferase